MKKKLLILIVLLTGFSFLNAQNLLTNGSFEDLTSDGAEITNFADVGTLNVWASNNAGKAAIRLSDQSPQDGAQCIYWQAGEKGPIRQVVELTDGVQYRASVWVKWTEGAVNTGATTLKVEAGGTQIALVDLNGMETAWTEYTLEFTAVGTSHEIYINRLGTDAVGEMYVDNAVLAVVTVDNLVTNGSFEDFSTDENGNIIFAALGTYDAWAVPGWLPKDNILLSDQSPQEGSKSVYFAESKDGPIKQRVALTDGNRYQASVWVKWTPGADNKGDTQFKVDAQGEANTGGSTLATVLLDGLETEWTEYTFEFTASGTSHEIVVYRWGLDADNKPVGDMYVDNVVLTDLGPASEYTLTVTIAGQGDVMVDGTAYTEALVFEAGTQVSLSAVAAVDWEFSSWSGDLVSANAAETITMDADKTITATFADVNSDGNLIADGSFEDVTSDEVGAIFDGSAWWVHGWSPKELFQLSTESPKDGSQSLYFADGQVGPVKQDVTLTTGHNYHASIWVKWSAGAVNTGATNFKVDFGGSEIAFVELNGMETEWTEYTFEFAAEGEPHLIAVYRWGGEGAPPVGDMYIDHVVLTDLGPAVAEYTLTVTTVGEGDVMVDGTAYTEALVFEEGTQVSLSAVAAADWEFASWSGDLVSTDAAGTITMDADKNITATFTESAPAEYTLTVTTVGEGDVMVDGTAYTEALVFEEGTQVSLSAVAAADWEFASWSGDLVSTDAAGTITMDADKSITATFNEVTDVAGKYWENLKVYPNPFNNELRIDNAGGIQMVSVTNLIGQVVITQEIHGRQQFIIDTGNLEKGIYLLRLTGKQEEIRTMKLVKNQ